MEIEQNLRKWVYEIEIHGDNYDLESIYNMFLYMGYYQEDYIHEKHIDYGWSNTLTARIWSHKRLETTGIAEDIHENLCIRPLSYLNIEEYERVSSIQENNLKTNDYDNLSRLTDRKLLERDDDDELQGLGALFG